MKLKYLIPLALIFAIAIALFIMSDSTETSVTWQTLGNKKEGNTTSYIQRFTIKSNEDIDKLCFNQFARKMVPVNTEDSVVEIVPGYYYIKSPRLSSCNDSVVIDIEVYSMLSNICYAPDGVHIVTVDGKTSPVKFHRKSMIDNPTQWGIEGRDRMPYGDVIYTFNESLINDSTLNSRDTLGVYNVIPSFKNVTFLGGNYIGDGAITRKEIAHKNPEYYRITINDTVVIVEYASQRALMTAERMLSIHRLIPTDGIIPNAVIEDYPDLHYHGVMIDIARNYQSVADMKTIAEILANYRMNVLHFHFADDEAWRLEIPGLPELTDVGSRRGYTLDERDHLVQIFAGNGDPNTTGGTANGYYTRDEFIDLLKYCHKLGIDVIPEIESPGHARAAIKSMEARYRNIGDATYRLIEDGDSSRYTSAQSFHDNVMNPALPGPYKFMEKVIVELEAMYTDAGVPLRAIHIGGDEVPKGAWNGSKSAQKMITDQKLDGEKGLHAEFVKQIAKILSSRGIPMNGWQEIAVGHSNEYNAEIAPLVGGVNCWTLSSTKTDGATQQAINGGYPIILSNVNHFYLDQCYNYHPYEKGLSWGGVVDEFATLSGYVNELCPTDSTTKGKVIGVCGHVFAETLRSFPQLQYYLFPKMLGLAERAWNVNHTFTPAQLNNIIGERELPRLSLIGMNFRLHQPGIIIDNGTVKMNKPYADAIIRYTLDGTEPTMQSPIYTEPFTTDAEQIRARLYYLGNESVTSILYLK